ncbi:mucin-17-like [Vanessa tameamea]|uniref:Mucin-17-like n=1 Tax=Vanessa tameamea TaxID=334116 RepID=A0A8B8IQP1_VANTA
MSGGRLVVLDRLGRDVKTYPLEEGLATIGSDPVCDIRVMLPTVSPHHATVVVHTNQTVVRSVSAGETLVNGVSVSVAALRHRDVLSVGGRALRWEYAQPARPRPLAPQPALVRRETRARGRRRGSEPATRAVLVPAQRASMPASSGGKQVAIVQPQRRDTNEQAESSRSNAKTSNKRPRTSRNDEQDSIIEGADGSKRKSSPRSSPKSPHMHDTTKATLWIESRKTPRAPALRLAAMRGAHRARTAPVAKIRAPAHIDHTKQAAIMLMTGHTPKSKQSPKSKQPSYVVKKPSPVRRTPKQKKPSPTKKTPKGKSLSGLEVTPKRMSCFSASRSSAKAAADLTASILEITDSDSQTVRGSNTSVRSLRRSTLRSPVLPTPKKSALKDPSAKKNTRKTESIKFDLSNLESNAQDRSSDILFITDTTKENSYNGDSADDLSLHYSDTSTTQSPSPRKSIHSRSSRMLEKSLGSTFVYNTPTQEPQEHRNISSESPHSQKSSRGSLIVQKALESSNLESSRYSRRTTRTVSDHSYSTTITSARKTKTLSPRSSNQNIESYSIVDLVSIGSNDSNRSVYNSAGSNNSTVAFDTPQTIASRTTRSNNPSLLGSSTPYLNRTSSPKPSPEVNRSTKLRVSTVTTRRSASITTPENSQKQTPFNSTRISKMSRSRSRINDSDILLVDDHEDSSPKSSRRTSKTSIASPIVRKNISKTDVPPESPSNGTLTPTNRYSPAEATTPVLSIQSLLDQSALSQSSITSKQSETRSRVANLKRKTEGTITSQPKKYRASIKSRSLSFSSKRSLRARKSSSDSIKSHLKTPKENQKIVTPKSAVKLVQEAVKNKHSTAKKPTSKRSIIDNLDESDFVKQLFNSPVKRKLSQSMTEFSRKQLFEDVDSLPLRPARRTTALTGRSPDNSLLNQSEAIPPEVFVSPLSTPGNSPNLSGIKRLFAKNTPENDLRNVRGVKSLLRTPRNRKSIGNDLSKVSGVKKVFARSPRNRLSDVRVKEVFAVSPQNDLRRVSGVKSLFQSTRKARTPKNTIDDLTGVKNLFQKSPLNDLQNVTGVKKTLRVNSPRNDLTDVRGVKQLYRHKEIRNDLSDLSGVEEIFHESHNLDSTFDQLIGKPRVRYYTKSKSLTTINKNKKQTRKTKSLHDSIGLITNNVERWLDNELKKRVHRPNESPAPKKSINKTNLTRELQKLSTNTIEGSLPIRTSRARNSTLTWNAEAELPSERKKSASEVYSAHTLPIKKRSLVETVARSGGESRNALPIKKRLVVHSTPVKGRVRAALDASELGRVSPIARARSPGKTPQAKESPKAKTSKARTTKLPETQIPDDLPKPSPRRTRGKTSVRNSPQRVRVTRGKKIGPPVANAKKRRSSIVITKKPPVMSPVPKTTKIKTVTVTKSKSNTSPKKTRSKRQKPQAEEKIITPKKTRTKTNVKSVSITKPSLQPKARPTRQGKKIQEPVVDNNDIKGPKRGRKAADNKITTRKTEELKLEQRKLAGKIVTENKSKTKTRNVDIATNQAQTPPKKTRKNNLEINQVDKSQKRSKATGEKVEKQITVESDQIRPTRGRKPKDNMTTTETGKRQRKVTIVEEPTANKASSVEVVSRKGRRGTKVAENVEPPIEKVNKQGKDVKTDIKKGKRAKNSVAESETEAPTVDGKRAKKTASKEQNKSVKTETRVVEEVPKTKGRKRKTKIEESLVEEPADKRRRCLPATSIPLGDSEEQTLDLCSVDLLIVLLYHAVYTFAR